MEKNPFQTKNVVENNYFTKYIERYSTACNVLRSFVSAVISIRIDKLRSFALKISLRRFRPKILFSLKVKNPPQTGSATGLGVYLDDRWRRYICNMAKRLVRFSRVTYLQCFRLVCIVVICLWIRPYIYLTRKLYKFENVLSVNLSNKTERSSLNNRNRHSKGLAFWYTNASSCIFDGFQESAK